MHVIFYQTCWNVVDKPLYSMTRTFLHRGYLLKEFNNTHITLIPKKENLARVNDFSFDNVSYKFI